MNQAGSYQIHTIASDVDIEVKRLKAQVELFWDKEWKRYAEFGVRDGMAIAELGSGPGFLTERLLNRLPAANVTSIEIDGFLVDYARRYLDGQGLTRFEVIQGSALDTGLPSGRYDVVIARLLLEHLPDPLQALREMHRILKPGGKAIIVDNDFEMHIMTSPAIPELRALYEAYCASRAAQGGNPRIGRELPVWLKKGGFSHIDFEIIHAHSAIVGEALFAQSEGVGIPAKLVKDGFLTSKTLGQISVKWRDMLQAEEHAIMRQLYMAVGEKLGQEG